MSAHQDAPAPPSVHFTIAIIKPDVSEKPEVVSDVFQRIEQAGLHVDHLHVRKRCAAFWSVFYGEHNGRPYFNDLVAHMESGSSIFMVLTGDDVVSKWRAAMGPIREAYATGGPANAVHGSDSIASAAIEWTLVFSAIEWSHFIERLEGQS